MEGMPTSVTKSWRCNICI